MIIDLTHTITPEMPMYPGSAAPSIKPTGSLTRDGFRETQLTIASHTGTHMDAPSHMLPRGSTLEVLPASQFCGRAVVLDVSDLPPRSVITADYLREQNGTIRSAVRGGQGLPPPSGNPARHGRGPAHARPRHQALRVSYERGAFRVPHP